MDIMSYWQRVAAANFSLSLTAMRLAEAMVAATTVIRVRGDMINMGLKSPRDTDWREMGVMVSEKLFAFGQSGSAASRELDAVQARLLADWQQAMILPFSAASPDAAANAGARVAMLGLDMLELTARLAEVAVAPIHQTVTANARRLR